MQIRPLTHKIAATAALAVVGVSFAAGISSAAPPAVDQFDVQFVDPSCGPGMDAATTLHVRFIDKQLPDGGVHHWLDLDGAIHNDAAGKVVTVHAARRFTDSPTGDSSTFRGLMIEFSAADGGVLFHASGFNDGALVHGRWDISTADGLPSAVCEYLFG